MIKLNELLQLVEKNFKTFFIFTIVFAATFIYLIGAYIGLHHDYIDVSAELQAKNNELHKKELLFKDEQRQHDRDIAEAALELQQAKNEVENILHNTQGMQAILKEQIAIVENHPLLMGREQELADLIEEQKQLRAAFIERFSYEVKKEKAESDVRLLMSKFAELGVEIRRPDRCNEDYMRRYRQGVALIGQIKAISQEYGLGRAYINFVEENSSVGGIATFYDGDCG